MHTPYQAPLMRFLSRYGFGRYIIRHRFYAVSLGIVTSAIGLAIILG